MRLFSSSWVTRHGDVVVLLAGGAEVHGGCSSWLVELLLSIPAHMSRLKPGPQEKGSHGRLLEGRRPSHRQRPRGKALAEAGLHEAVKLLVRHAVGADGQHSLVPDLLHEAANVGTSAGIAVGGLDVHGGSPLVVELLLSIQARMSRGISRGRRTTRTRAKACAGSSRCGGRESPGAHPGARTCRPAQGSRGAPHALLPARCPRRR